MADGSPCIYTAAKSIDTTEILLECTQENARKLATFAPEAEFFITGLNVIGNLHDYDVVQCYLTGAISIELISENADICQVNLPVQVVNI